MQRCHSITASLMDTICTLVEQDHSPTQAALSCGVPQSTWSRWIRRGRGYEQPASEQCQELVRRIDEASQVATERRIEQYGVRLEQSHQQVVSRLHYKIRMQEQELIRLRSGVCQHQVGAQPALPPQHSTIRVKSRRHRRWA